MYFNRAILNPFLFSYVLVTLHTWTKYISSATAVNKKKCKRSVTKKKVLNQREIETGFINLPNHSF